jgi:hypothetical protein
MKLPPAAPVLQGVTPAPRARVRVRTNLTSVQINDEQKQTIDQAYKVFKASSGISGVTKGQFIEGLAEEFLQHAGGSVDIEDGSLTG